MVDRSTYSSLIRLAILLMAEEIAVAPALPMSL